MGETSTSTSYSSMGMGTSDAASMKEALMTQQKLLQKLYAELEQEREASATAASEALSMILRIQEEKAAEKMEATQYKRMTEEKMQHVERSLLLVKELMYQKDIEIASLEFQVQAYRYKMLSMGLSDLVISEMRFGDNRYGDSGGNGNIRRNQSLPVSPFNNSTSDKVTVEIDGQVYPMAELFPKRIDDEPPQQVDARGEETNTYWEQIKHLDERVEELSHTNGFDRSRSWSWSVESEMNRDSNSEPVIEPILDSEVAISRSSYHVEDPFAPSVNSRLVKDKRNPPDSLGVYDVFEVPQNLEIPKIPRIPTKKEAKKSMVKEQTFIDSDLKQTNLEFISKEEAEPVNKGVLHPSKKNKINRPIDGLSIDCNLAARGSEIGVSQSEAEVQYLSKQLDQLDGQRRLSNHDGFDRREEELRLLREINEKLDMVRDELRGSTSKKFPPAEEPSLNSVREAMLFFTL
ncbi:hypothetical protein MKW94_005466 [Papaver nudicaule]|uniref:GTD-binding domain-containing protein n=1 Tax=Papaver nudicaule TaxID=74823 RepID=A0AA41V403_PAPNU|nr:hypothetical protein [Papaver nudicaule]